MLTLMFFMTHRWISSNDINMNDIGKWQLQSLEIIYLNEYLFPTSILDVQLNLLIHLVEEVCRYNAYTMDILP